MSLSISKKVDLGPQGKKFKKMRPLSTPQFVKNIGSEEYENLNRIESENLIVLIT
jgi:hypothetical protein